MQRLLFTSSIQRVRDNLKELRIYIQYDIIINNNKDNNNKTAFIILIK